MGSVFTVPAFLDALRTVLVARAGLSGVNVYTAGVDATSAGAECIVLGQEKISGEGEYPYAGEATVRESYDVPGSIFVAAPGGDETTIKAARDRAFAILEQVLDQLVVSYTTSGAVESGLGVRSANLTNWDLTQGVTTLGGTDHRVAQVDFAIGVRTNFTPA